VTPQNIPSGWRFAGNESSQTVRWKHSISGRWDLPSNCWAKIYAIIQVLVTLQDWCGTKPMGKKNSKKTGKLLDSAPHGSLDSGPLGSDRARQADGGWKSLVPQRAIFAEYRGLYMHPQIAQVLYSEGILLANLCSNAKTKGHTMCVPLCSGCAQVPLLV